MVTRLEKTLVKLQRKHRHQPPFTSFEQVSPNSCSCGLILKNPEMWGDWAQAAKIHDRHFAGVAAAEIVKLVQEADAEGYCENVDVIQWLTHEDPLTI